MLKKLLFPIILFFIFILKPLFHRTLFYYSIIFPLFQYLLNGLFHILHCADKKRNICLAVNQHIHKWSVKINTFWLTTFMIIQKTI